MVGLSQRQFESGAEVLVNVRTARVLCPAKILKVNRSMLVSLLAGV